MPTTFVPTVATLRSPGKKSSQFTDGFLTVDVRSTRDGTLAMFGAQLPYRYEMSGGLPPRTAVETFCRE